MPKDFKMRRPIRDTLIEGGIKVYYDGVVKEDLDSELKEIFERYGYQFVTAGFDFNFVRHLEFNKKE